MNGCTANGGVPSDASATTEATGWLDNRTWLVVLPALLRSTENLVRACEVIQCPEEVLPTFSIDCGGTNGGGGILENWFLQMQNVFPDAIHSCYDGPARREPRPDHVPTTVGNAVLYNPTGRSKEDAGAG
jgi:hypothetical protein